MIAFGYANGAHVITPWDEYIHGKERLFADPADFADLYGFARAPGEAGYLNGYEKAPHEKASASGDYSALAKEVSLKTENEGNWTVVEVPALNPWGTLVVKEEGE